MQKTPISISCAFVNFSLGLSAKTKQKEVLSTENSFNVLTKNSDSLTIDLVALLRRQANKHHHRDRGRRPCLS
jgi:hypothetical protein